MEPHAKGVRRILAYIVDALIVFIITLPLTIYVAIQALQDIETEAPTEQPSFSDIFSMEFTLLAIGTLGVRMLISLAYFTYQEAKSGQTLGKKFLEVKVVQGDLATPITGEQALKRNLARLLWFIPFGLGTIFMLVDTVLILISEHKRIGDRVADTAVVSTTYIPVPYGGHPAWIPPQTPGWPPPQSAPPDYGGQQPPYGHYPPEGAPGPAPPEAPYPEPEAPPPEEPVPGDSEFEAPPAATEAEPAPSEKRERLPGDPDD